MLSTIIWILLLAGLLINGYYKTVLAMFILPIFIIVYAFLSADSAIKDSATSSGGGQDAADLSSVEATPLPAPSPVLSQPTCKCRKMSNGKCRKRQHPITKKYICITRNNTKCPQCPASGGI